MESFNSIVKREIDETKNIRRRLRMFLLENDFVEKLRTLFKDKYINIGGLELKDEELYVEILEDYISISISGLDFTLYSHVNPPLASSTISFDIDLNSSYYTIRRDDWSNAIEILRLILDNIELDINSLRMLVKLKD